MDKILNFIADFKAQSTTMGDVWLTEDIDLMMVGIDVNEVGKLDQDILNDFFFEVIKNRRPVQYLSKQKIKAFNCIMRTKNPVTKLKRYMAWGHKFLKSPYSFMLLSDEQKDILNKISNLQIEDINVRA